MDHKTLYNSKHWYITWMPSLPSWRIHVQRNWFIAMYLGALGITFYPHGYWG